MTRAEIMRHAVEAGFAISTAYGETEPKLMPTANSQTLVNFARRVIQATITELDRKPNRKPVLEEHGVYLAMPGGGGQFVRRESGGPAFGSGGVPAVRVTFEKTGADE